MPITVGCRCGKVFKVKDELAGSTVTCQVCGAACAVPESDSAPAAIAPISPLSPPNLIPSNPVPVRPAPAVPAQIQCPACAEMIPAKSVRCPFCKETLKDVISDEEQRELLQVAVAQIDEHVANPQALEADVKMRGMFLSVWSIVSGALLLVCMVMVIYGSSQGRSGEGFLICGIIFGIVPAICLIVALANDWTAAKFQTQALATNAFKGYFKTAQTGRSAKAFAGVAPAGRSVGAVRTLMFEKSGIPAQTGRYSITNVKTFGEYWKSITTGPSGQTRAAKLKTITSFRKISPNMEVVSASFEFTSYPSWIVGLVILGGLGIIAVLLVIMMIQKKESILVKKLMIKRGGLWYVAEGEFDGKLDHLTISSLTA